jgi:hypothetical protein
MDRIASVVTTLGTAPRMRQDAVSSDRDQVRGWVSNASERPNAGARQGHFAGHSER